MPAQLADLVEMLDCLQDTRFYAIQESGYRDHHEFLKRHCRAVKVLHGSGMSANLQWDPQCAEGGDVVSD